MASPWASATAADKSRPVIRKRDFIDLFSQLRQPQRLNSWLLSRIHDEQVSQRALGQRKGRKGQSWENLNRRGAETRRPMLGNNEPQRRGDAAAYVGKVSRVGAKNVSSIKYQVSRPE